MKLIISTPQLIYTKAKPGENFYISIVFQLWDQSIVEVDGNRQIEVVYKLSFVNEDDFMLVLVEKLFCNKVSIQITYVLTSIKNMKYTFVQLCKSLA